GFDPRAKQIPVARSELKLPLRNSHLDLSKAQIIALDLWQTGGGQNHTTGWCCPQTRFCCRVHYRLRRPAPPFPSKEHFALLAAAAHTAAALGQARYPIRQEICALVV